MFTVRRWWDRHGIQIVVTGLVLGTAWFLRQTQAGAIAELSALIARPFQGEPKAVLEERLKNARILELEQRVADLETQNQNLKKLLRYFDDPKQRPITAPIIGRSPDHWWQQITLGRGHQDGIQEGFIVMGIGGLIGRVVEVTPHTSRVLLVSDPSSRVGATVSRSRYMGLIEGRSGQTAVMKFFEKVPDARPGDMVTTSSVSRLFPSGLPIGRIKSVNLNQGPAPEAVIELTAPFNNLEWVVVYEFKSKT
jgi:rod shape-determining protein MreC